MANLLTILLAVLIGIVFAVLGFYFGFNYRKNKAEKAIGSAEQEANRILSDAINLSETKKKEAIL